MCPLRISIELLGMHLNQNSFTFNSPQGTNKPQGSEISSGMENTSSSMVKIYRQCDSPLPPTLKHRTVKTRSKEEGVVAAAVFIPPYTELGLVVSHDL